MEGDAIDWIKKNWKKPRYLGLFFMILTILWFWHLNITTRPIPNLIEMNETTGEAILMYDPSSYAPPTWVVFGQALVGTFLVGAVFFVMRQDIKGEDFILVEEAVKIVTKKVRKDQNAETLPLGSVKVHASFLRIKIDKSKIKWNRWVVGITIIDDVSVYHYFKYYIEPTSGAIIGNAIPMEVPLEDKDMCWRCGKEFDIRIVRAEDLQMITQLSKEVGALG